MTLAELAEKAKSLPDRMAFVWPGAEHFHEDVFEREVNTLPEAIEYIKKLRKRMADYSYALSELGDAYKGMRELLLSFEVERQ